MGKESDKIRTGVTPKPTSESKLIIESLDGLHRLRPTSEAPPTNDQPPTPPDKGSEK